MGTVTTVSASASIQAVGDLSIDNPVTSSGYAYYVTCGALAVRVRVRWASGFLHRELREGT